MSGDLNSQLLHRFDPCDLHFCCLNNGLVVITGTMHQKIGSAFYKAVNVRTNKSKAQYNTIVIDKTHTHVETKIVNGVTLSVLWISNTLAVFCQYHFLLQNHKIRTVKAFYGDFIIFVIYLKQALNLWTTG